MALNRRVFLKAAAAAPAGAAALSPGGEWQQKFASPDRNLRPITWYFPSGPDATAIANDLSGLKKLGLGGICIMPASSALKVPYLSEAYWRTIRLTLEEAVRQDFRVWLYDEIDYPSSSAGGETLRQHPEYGVTALECYTTPVTGGSLIEIPIPEGDLVRAIAAGKGESQDLSGAIDIGKLRWEAPPGAWNIHLFLKRIGDPLAAIAKGRAGLVRPLANLLDANAIREFISNTYEGYARAVGRHFGRNIEAMFTDEPCLHVAGYWEFGIKPEAQRPWLPWVDGFSEYFIARNGYDVLPKLGCLVADCGPETSKVRCDYWEVVSDLIATSYYEQLRDWCARHGIAFSGHQLLEEGLLLHLMFSGSFIRNAGRQHIPGMDLIGPRPEGVSLEDTMTRAGGPYVGKLLSSAAHTRGRTEVMSESFAASGYEMTLEKIVAIANWQFATGVTEIMPMGRHHISGRRPPPDSEEVKRFYADPFFQDPSYYGTYLGRCKALLTGGIHVADIAVLVPEVSIWANYTPAPVGLPYQAYRERNPVAAKLDDDFVALSMELLRHQLDFDYLDDEAFLSAGIRGGKIVLAGEAYGTLVLPPATTIRHSVAMKIEEFRRSGGQVVACGQLPGESMERGKDAAVRDALKSLRSVTIPDAPAAIRALGQPDISLAAPHPKLFYIHKRKEGRDIYFLANMAAAAGNLNIRFRDVRPAASIWDPGTGKMQPANAVASGAGATVEVAVGKLSAVAVVFG